MDRSAALLLALLAPVAFLGAEPVASPSECAKDPRACERASNLRRPSDYGKALGGVQTRDPSQPRDPRENPRPRVVVIVVPGSSVGVDHESAMPEPSGGDDERTQDGSSYWSVLDETPEPGADPHP